MNKIFRKTLSIALIAASICTTGAVMPAMSASAAATSSINAEIANNNYYVAFKEPYTASKIFKNQTADDKFQSVMLSASDSFILGVYNTKSFKTTDTITVYSSKTEKGTYKAVKTVNPKAAASQFLTLKQAPGSVMYYSVEVKNSKGTVQYAQRYKVTIAKEEVGNNKYTFEFSQTTVAGDTSSYKATKLNVSKADNVQPVINLLDTERFYFNVKDVPDGYYLEVEADSLKYRDYKPATQTFGRCKPSNGVISFSDYIYRDDAKSMKFTLHDVSGNTVMCARFKIIGVADPLGMRTYLYYNFDNGESHDISIYTNEKDVKEDVSTKVENLAERSYAKVHSRYILLNVYKDGGLYNDTDTLKIYVKPTASTKYGEPVQTLNHTTTSDYYRAYVVLPKTGTAYDIKTEMKTPSGKTITHIFTNVTATTPSSIGFTENYYKMDPASGKVSSQSSSTFVSEGDIIKETNAIELPVYSNPDSYSKLYRLTVGGMGDPQNVYRVYTKVDGVEKLVYEKANLTSGQTLTLSDFDITPKAGKSFEVIIREFNANDKKIIQWSRTVRFVEPRLFKFTLNVSNYESYSDCSIYRVEKELDANVVLDSEKATITNGPVYVNTKMRIHAEANSTVSGIPSGVTGTVYIKKAGDSSLTKLCSVADYINKGYADKAISDTCARCGYALKNGSSYTIYVTFYNKNTKKTFYNTSFSFKYSTLNK